MPKIQRQNPAVPPEIIYSREELLEVAREIKIAGGERQWLIKQGAIRLDEFGERVVIAKVVGQNDEGKNSYDIPYARLSDKLKQLDKLRGKMPGLLK